MESKTLTNQIISEEQGKFDLVRGEFTPEEALEIVNDLFFKKINFNSLKNFSQKIRYGSNDPDLEQRVSELKAAQARAQELIAEGKESGKTIRVNSMISIELV